MQNELKVAVIQTHLFWENPNKNREHLSRKIKSILEPIDLIVLPEMFTTGFTMNARPYAEKMNGETIRWMTSIAQEKNAAIMGSLIIKEYKNFYNRLVFVFPDGYLVTYNKRHTFTLAGEDKIYTAGKEKVLIDFKGWKICPLVCYDLRFPVWSRNVANYDVLIYVANWPKARIEAWNTLLKARAIENMSYCLGINRVGFDGNNYEYTGHSKVFNVLGDEISNISPSKEQIEIVTLFKDELKKFRKKLQFLDDRDSFNLKV